MFFKGFKNASFVFYCSSNVTYYGKRLMFYKNANVVFSFSEFLNFNAEIKNDFVTFFMFDSLI